MGSELNNICTYVYLHSIIGAVAPSPMPDRTESVKPVTDEQVFYDKFLCGKFYLPSARVYMRHILYDKFLDSFTLLVNVST